MTGRTCDQSSSLALARSATSLAFRSNGVTLAYKPPLKYGVPSNLPPAVMPGEFISRKRPKSRS